MVIGRFLVSIAFVAGITLGGCIADDPFQDDAPHATATGSSSSDGETNHSAQEDDSGPYIEYSNMTTSLTDFSPGFETPPLEDPEHTVKACWDVPDELRVVVEWEHPHSFSDLEFRMEHPSQPDKARGSSPLLWEHEIDGDDEAEDCPAVYLRADQTGVNALVDEGIVLRFTMAFNGAQLP